VTGTRFYRVLSMGSVRPLRPALAEPWIAPLLQPKEANGFGVSCVVVDDDDDDDDKGRLGQHMNLDKLFNRFTRKKHWQQGALSAPLSTPITHHPFLVSVDSSINPGGSCK
jgi:hypothetical protein